MGLTDERPVLSPGERQVWAAVFAAEAVRAKRNAPSGLHSHGSEAVVVLHEIEAALGAAELAWVIVRRMRDAAPRIAEEWGEDAENYRMIAEMTEHPEPEAEAESGSFFAG